MTLDLFNIEPGFKGAPKDKARKATDDEIRAYAKWLRDRQGIAQLELDGLHWHDYGKRGGRVCIGATFGLIKNSGYGHARAIECETGAHSVIFPGHRAHRDTVTMETVDECGEIVASQTLPVEPKKGGVIWSRADVHKAAGKVAKLRKVSKPIPAEEIEARAAFTCEPTTDSSAAQIAELVDGDTEWRDTSWDDLFAAQEITDGDTIRGLGLVFGVDNFRIYQGGCQVRGALPKRFVGIHERAMKNSRAGGIIPTEAQEPEELPAIPPLVTPESVSEAAPCPTPDIPEGAERASEGVSSSGDSEPEARSDAVAALAARLDALEARIGTLSAESAGAPIEEIRPKRTAAHERAIRRAWAERRARTVLQNKRARAVVLAKRQWKMRLLARSQNLASEGREDRQRELRQGNAERARRMIASARHAERSQRQRAQVAESALAKLRKDMANPAEPERASDIAQLVRERDEARTANAALQDRCGRMQAALDKAAGDIEGLAVRVARAESAMRNIAA